MTYINRRLYGARRYEGVAWLLTSAKCACCTPPDGLSSLERLEWVGFLTRLSDLDSADLLDFISPRNPFHEANRNAFEEAFNVRISPDLDHKLLAPDDLSELEI